MASRSVSPLIILPAWNEAACIAQTVTEVRGSASDVHVLVVDDGSSDNTAALALSAGANVVTHPFNLGVAAAESTGLRWAEQQGYRRVVRMDADGQHDAACLRDLMAALEVGADLVVGSRFLQGEADGSSFRSSALRRAGSTVLARLLTGLSGVTMTDPTSGFRAFGPRAIALFAAHFPHDYPEPESVLMAARRGLVVREVPVRMRPRRAGQSSITPAQSVVYMAKVSLALVLERMRGVNG